MQRTWMRALVFTAAIAATSLVVSDAEAGRRRGGCGSSGGSYSGYSSGGYNKYGYGGYPGGYSYSKGAWAPGTYSRGGTAGATYDASGRYIGPAVSDPNARAGVGIDPNAQPSGEVSPSDRPRTGVDAGVGAGVRGTVTAPDTSIPPPPPSTTIPPPAPTASPAPNVPAVPDVRVP